MLLLLVAAAIACMCCVRRSRRRKREEVAKRALALQPPSAAPGSLSLLPHAPMRSKSGAAAVDSAGELYASSAFSRGGHGDAYSGESAKESFRLQVCCVLGVLCGRNCLEAGAMGCEML